MRKRQQKLQLQQQNDAAKLADRQQERAEKLKAEADKARADDDDPTLLAVADGWSAAGFSGASAGLKTRVS